MSESPGSIVTPKTLTPWSPEQLTQNPLRTERLILRPLAAADAPDVWLYQRDAEVLRYIPWTERTQAEAREHTAQRAAAGGTLSGNGDHVFLAVGLAAGPEAGRVIGDVMLRIASAFNLEVEVGWVFASDKHGQGYATEAAVEAVRLAFEKLDAQRVIAHLDDRNAASVSLCKRLGMRHEGTTFEKEWEPSGWVNLELYGIHREEWLAFDSGSPAPDGPSPIPVRPRVASEGPPTALSLPYDFTAQATFPLLTERLTIRQFRTGDVADLHSLMSDPEVTRYLPQGALSEAEVVAAVEKNMRNTTLTEDGSLVKLVLSVGEQFVGQMKLEVSSVAEHALEIGWILGPKHQGKGLALEAATALLTLAFDEVSAHRVIAYLNPENHASAVLATRLGMRLEHHSRADWPEADGSWSDTAIYAITAAEWRSQNDKSSAGHAGPSVRTVPSRSS